jgi:hypothetical protein
MYIVPQDDQLVITSRIETIHIDQVHVGQAATLRFSAFDQPIQRPSCFGTVQIVSADVLQDEVDGPVLFTRRSCCPTRASWSG